MNFPEAQSLVIQAFGLASTIIFCVEAIAKIGAAAWEVVREAFRGEKEK